MIPRGSNRYLKQEWTVLAGSGFEINLFCPNSDRIH
jgi:hypothetical protein